MDIQDSSCEREPSFDWKDSCFKHDNMIRRVHSTPLMLRDVRITPESTPCCQNGSGKPKKLFVSFRQEVEEDNEVKPALSYRSLHKFNTMPEPDCIVMLCRRKFHCNAGLLQEYSLLFRQLDIQRNSVVPLILNSGNQIYPNTFWLVYQWMHSRKNKDDLEFINLHWVAQLYLASKYLAIQELQDASYRYLTDRENIKEEKAFFIYQGLYKYEAKDLCDYLISLIQGSFTALTGTQDFLDLNCEQVLQLLYSQYIVVSGEVEVFYAGVRWLLDQLEERDIYIEEIMSTVRFHFMELKQLLKISREFPKITGKSPVSLMIERAIRIAVLKNEDDDKNAEEYFTHLTKPRNSMYKPINQHVESYREYIHLSRRRREKNSRLYQNLSRLCFKKTRFVEDMENLYITWKINNSSWETIHSKSSYRKMSSTFN